MTCNSSGDPIKPDGSSVHNFRSYYMANLPTDSQPLSFGALGKPIDTDVRWPIQYIRHGYLNSEGDGLSRLNESYFKFTWTVQPQGSAGSITDIWIDTGSGGLHPPRELGENPTWEHISMGSQSSPYVTRTYGLWPAGTVSNASSETHAIVVVYQDNLCNQKGYVYYLVSKGWSAWDVYLNKINANGTDVTNYTSPIALNWHSPGSNSYQFNFGLSYNSNAGNATTSNAKIGLKIDNRIPHALYYPSTSGENIDGTISPFDISVSSVSPAIIPLSTETYTVSDGSLQLNPRLAKQTVSPWFVAPDLAKPIGYYKTPAYPIEDLIQDW